MKRLLITAIVRDMSQSIAKIVEEYTAFKEYCHTKGYETTFVIYENNSIDDSKERLSTLTKHDPSIHIYKEDINENDKFHSRDIYCKPHKYEKIAFAWTRISNIIRSPNYNDYIAVILIDVSIDYSWPLESILENIGKIESKATDIVIANVINSDGTMVNPDTYRDKKYRVGPEVVGIRYYVEDYNDLKQLKIDSEEVVPVVSYYGGLLLIDRSIINEMKFSAFPTPSLARYYEYNTEDIIHNTKNVEAPTYINGMYMCGCSAVDDTGLFYYFTHNTNSPIVHPMVNFLTHLYVIKKRIQLVPSFIWKNYEDNILRL